MLTKKDYVAIKNNAYELKFDNDCLLYGSKQAKGKITFNLPQKHDVTFDNVEIVKEFNKVATDYFFGKANPNTEKLFSDWLTALAEYVTACVLKKIHIASANEHIRIMRKELQNDRKHLARLDNLNKQFEYKTSPKTGNIKDVTSSYVKKSFNDEIKNNLSDSYALTSDVKIVIFELANICQEWGYFDLEKAFTTLKQTKHIINLNDDIPNIDKIMKAVDTCIISECFNRVRKSISDNKSIDIDHVEYTFSDIADEISVDDRDFFDSLDIRLYRNNRICCNADGKRTQFVGRSSFADKASIDYFVNSANATLDKSGVKLSDKERQILFLRFMGMGKREICDALEIYRTDKKTLARKQDIGTLDKYVSRIRTKCLKAGFHPLNVEQWIDLLLPLIDTMDFSSVGK